MNVPYLTRYRNSEYLQYMKNVLELVNDTNLDNLAAQIATLTPLVDQIDATFQQGQGSTLTQEISILDDRRDKAIVGLRTTIEGYKNHFEASVTAAANALFNNIDMHGTSVQRLSYQEETAVLNSIITDWETERELADAVATLNISSWLAELKTANTAFNTKYLERVEETAANSEENMPQLRNDATVAYRDLIAHITAHTTLNTDTGYLEVQDKISVLTGQYNQLVDNRTSTTDTSDDVS